MLLICWVSVLCQGPRPVTQRLLISNTAHRLCDSTSVRTLPGARDRSLNFIRLQPKGILMKHLTITIRLARGSKPPAPPPPPAISQQGPLPLCWLSALCSRWLQKPSLTGCVPRSPCSLAAFHWVLRLHLSQSQWSQEWPDEWPGLSHTKAHKLWAEQAWPSVSPGECTVSCQSPAHGYHALCSQLVILLHAFVTSLAVQSLSAPSTTDQGLPQPGSTFSAGSFFNTQNHRQHHIIEATDYSPKTYWATIICTCADNPHAAASSDSIYQPTEPASSILPLQAPTSVRTEPVSGRLTEVGGFRSGKTKTQFETDS